MDRPLRFCHLSIFYPPYSFGGDAAYLHRLVNELARRGHEVDIIHCADSFHALHRGEPQHKSANHPNVTVHTLRSGWGMLSPLLSQQTGGTWLKTDRIREILLGKKFDVIHYHNISLFGPRVLQIAPDYSDFIKLYTTHEHWLVCPMHTLWKNNARLCDRPTCFTCTLAYGRPPQWWRYTRLLEKCAASVDAFVSPSRFTSGQHAQRGFSRPVGQLPYFVPLGEFHTEPGAAPHPRPYFLFVGRLEKLKGLQTVLPVFRDYPHADLLVAGKGEYEGELRRQAGGMSNVVFLGAQPPAALDAYYRHAIALVAPSVTYETFGIVILEAYRQRTPVIARALGGLQEVVEESGGGFAYQSNEELLAAMERLRTQAALRSELGERGHRTYLERWTEDAHLRQYFALIEQTAQKKFGRVPWEGSKSRFLPDAPHAARVGVESATRRE